MNVFIFTEAGGHPINEDAFRVEPHPADPRLSIVGWPMVRAGKAAGPGPPRSPSKRPSLPPGRRRLKT